jgi:Tol biopolymer transport system component/biopolymer transport protein ExbD
MLWDRATGAVQATFKEKQGIRCVAFSPDGQKLATGGYDGLVKLRDPATGEATAVLAAHKVRLGFGVNSLAFSPDGKHLATGGSDNRIRLWDLTNPTRAVTFAELPDWVISVAYSPDGKTLATTLFGDGIVRLWDVATQKEVRLLRSPEVRALDQQVEQIAFSPDGKTLATASRDGSVRLWDVATGRVNTTLDVGPFFTSAVWYVAFSPDGKLLATASGPPRRSKEEPIRPGELRLWDAATGKLLAAVRGHDGQVTCAVFSPDGRYVATASWDGTVKLWNVSQLRARGVSEAPTRQQRQLRWTLIFNTLNGQDYLRQLNDLGAILAVPGADDKYLVIRDLLRRPAEMKAENLAGLDRIYWVDDKPQSVQGLATAMALSQTPKHIVALFPQKLERELLDKELMHLGNRGSEDSIAETRFRIVKHGQLYVPVVVEQRLKEAAQQGKVVGLQLQVENGKPVLRLEGEVVAVEDLAAALRRHAGGGPMPEVLFLAAQDTPYRIVVDIQKALQTAGAGRIVMAAEQPSGNR